MKVKDYNFYNDENLQKSIRIAKVLGVANLFQLIWLVISIASTYIFSHPRHAEKRFYQASERSQEEESKNKEI